VFLIHIFKNSLSLFVKKKKKKKIQRVGLGFLLTFLVSASLEWDWVERVGYSF